MSDEGMKQDVDGRHYNHEDREKMLGLRGAGQTCR